MGTDTVHAHASAHSMAPHIKISTVQLVSLVVTLTTYNPKIKFL